MTGTKLKTNFEALNAIDVGAKEPSPEKYFIYFDSISKHYPSIIANDSITLGIKAGTIHALLGENGAGKTTLMNMLGGISQPNSGGILLNGQVLRLANPRHARKAGIGMVHQHTPVLSSLTIAEYILMDDPKHGWFVQKGAYEYILSKELNTYGIKVDPSKYIWELSPAERRWLEVFRMLRLGASLLILDEPTSLLSPVQGDELLKRVRSLSDGGKTVILVTHKLREVKMFADYVTVLRQGKVVETLDVSTTSNDQLADLMVGNGTTGSFSANCNQVDKPKDPLPVFDVQHLYLKSPKGNYVLQDLCFSLNRGEILGIAGIAGNGQDELAEIMAGLEKSYSGHLELKGTNKSGNNGRIRYIPADRLTVGAPGELSLEENLVLCDLKNPAISKFGFLRRKAMKSLANKRAQRFEVRSVDLESPTVSLSGGNIQRLILARELDGEYDILVAHEPTAGLDIKAVRFVRNKLSEAAAAGIAIFLISSDLDEIMGIADRIMVLHAGRIMGIFENGSIGRAAIGALMAGHTNLTEKFI